jgi:hypothetical protein
VVVVVVVVVVGRSRAKFYRWRSQAPPPDSGAPASCGDASVVFELNYDGLLCPGTTCLGGGGVNAGGPPDWLTIATPDGESVEFLPVFVPCSACDTCQQSASCEQGCAIAHPALGPEALTWSGETYPLSHCNGGPTCMTSACAAAGTYTATMCLRLPAADGGQGSEMTCKTLSFTWPPPQGDVGPVALPPLRRRQLTASPPER